MTPPSGPWAEGDPLSPTNLNSRIPSWVSSSATTGIISPNLISSAINYVLNVKTDFGAVGDGTTDDTLAIQSALSSAASAAITGGLRTVYFPPGRFLISQPLRVTHHGIRLLGMDQGFQTEREAFATGISPSALYATSFYGPLVIVESSDVTFSRLTGPLIGSSGSAYFANGTGNHYSFSDLPYSNVSGLSTFCVECFFLSTNTIADNGRLVSSNVRIMPSDALSTAFSLNNNFGAARFSLNLTGGSITISGGTVADGIVHHIAGTYDGSKVRLFVDGTSVASAAGSGTISQHQFENVGVGGMAWRLLEQDVISNGDGTIDTPRISNAARYTANFTAPTSRLTADGNTLICANLDTQIGRFTKVTSKDHVGWARNVPSITPNPVGAIGTRFEGLHFLSTAHNVGIHLGYQTGFPSFHRCNFGTLRHGIHGPHSNHFQWHASELFFNGDGNSLFGIGLGLNSGIGHLDTAWYFGYNIPFAMEASGQVGVDNLYWVVTPGNQNYAGIIYNVADVANCPLVLNGFTVDTEVGADSSLRAGIMIGGSGTGTPGSGAVVSGCVFSSRQSIPYAIVDGAETVKFETCSFQMLDSTVPTSVVSVGASPVHPIVFDNCQQTSWTPWSNVTGTAIIAALGTKSSTSTGGTLRFDASVADAWDLTLTSDVTQSSWTKISYGQPVSGAIKMDSTGSRLFVWPTNSKGTATLSYGSAAVNTFTGFYDGVNVILTSVRTGL